MTACGPGVERIAEEVSKRFPDARIAVISSDITSSLAEVSAVFERMEKGEVDILIGTQIFGQGHHFPQFDFGRDCFLGAVGNPFRYLQGTQHTDNSFDLSS